MSSGARSRKWAFLALALMSLMAPLMAGIHWGYFTSSPIEGLDQPVELVIPAGSSFDDALEPLRDAHLVRNMLYFKILARYKKADTRVKAGTSTIRPGTTPGELLSQITEGGQGEEVVLTVYEGWTLYHVADRVEALGLDQRARFLKMASAPETLRRYGVEGESLEGYLFPDTYRFAPGAGAEAVIDRMVRQHQQVWRGLVTARGPDAVAALRRDHQLSSRELIILASIVEREAVVDDERPIIARVFLNRLQKKMPLQADPTCTYGPDIYLKKASPSLCKDPKSRYSTYVIDALPPGPIANPGRASLAAVLAPSEKPNEIKYLYFVAKPGGRRHTFSTTYKAHRKAIPR